MHSLTQLLQTNLLSHQLNLLIDVVLLTALDLHTLATAPHYSPAALRLGFRDSPLLAPNLPSVTKFLRRCIYKPLQVQVEAKAINYWKREQLQMHYRCC